ncbi:MAG: type II toxin-antitoxin system VapC family toxin [Actinomycetota bacterium]
MTIAVDSSALIAALTDWDGMGEVVADTIAGADLIAPHVVDLEVAHGLRRVDRHDGPTATVAMRRFRLMAIRRFSHRAHLPRIWELRHNLSAYDAAYVALAEASKVPLLTLDRKLANAPGHRAEIIVL